MQIIELPSAVKELYERSGSTVSIAKIFGVSSATVWRHLRKLGVCVRTKSEAAKLGVKMGRIKIKKHTISPPSKILTRKKSYLIGVLCGDGYLSYISKKGSYHIGLQAIDKEFVEKFAEYLYKVYGCLLYTSPSPRD